MVVGEEQEGCGRSELLSLKQQWRLGREQQERRQRAVASRAGELMQPRPGGGIRHLVVVLEKMHEPMSRDVEREPTAPLLLPGVPLPLIQVSPFHGGDELLRRATVVRVVRFPTAGGGDQRGVVEVIRPHAVETETLGFGPHKPRILRFVFGDDDDGLATGRRSRRVGDLLQEIGLGVIVNVVRRVEPQSVEVILHNPVPRVADHELTDRGRVLAVEVDGLAPVGAMSLADVPVGELRQVVPVGAEMVVDHVEDHAESFGMRPVHEPSQIVGAAVRMMRRKEIHAVVTPPEPAGKSGDRHQLDDRDAHASQLRQLVRRRREGTLGREGPDVHLVENLALVRYSRPIRVRPLEGPRVDDHRRAVRSLRLKAGRRIRTGVGVVQPKLVARTHSRHVDAAREVAVRLGTQRRHGVSELHVNAFSLWRPNAKVHAGVVVEELGADREATPDL